MFLFLESLSLSRFTSFFYFTSFVSDTLAAAFGCIYTFVMRINWSEKKSTMGETREGEEEGKERIERVRQEGKRNLLFGFLQAWFHGERMEKTDEKGRLFVSLLTGDRTDVLLPVLGAHFVFCPLSPVPQTVCSWIKDLNLFYRQQFGFPTHLLLLWWTLGLVGASIAHLSLHSGPVHSSWKRERAQAVCLCVLIVWCD